MVICRDEMRVRQEKKGSRRILEDVVHVEFWRMWCIRV